ncbi:type IX secretion system membrane protein PorP/SprF [Aquimarina sp. TRL1]|nr:type IX secretion system membrane protein PorP/SprF [Aquimarina sp. TRL1]QKX03819.1 type IX secretion system membrane protein PorP/SprF [Aquimarina sp. TRL1]QKX03821.1 type IX secretion system membrane protein PorP/SprF [Aquimarina sp. TRL1]
MRFQYSISILFLMLHIVLGYSQQDAQYTQYMYNTISVNPAYAGSRGVMSISGLHRSQWVGLDGAPRTQTLSMNTPIGESNRVGLGVSIVNDEIGPTQETYFDIDFSYTIPTSDVGKLSFGLKAGGHLLNVDFQRLSKFDVNDPSFENNIDNKFSPNVGIGLYYHTPRFYLGLSAPNLLETEHFDESATVGGNDSSAFVAKERINYYLITGHTFDLSSDVKFKPALLTKLVLGAPLQVDLSASFLLYERLSFGVGYRWDAALSGMVGFQVSDGLMVGFAYDRETTELGKAVFNDGSYEVLLRFELFKKYNRMLTPRFF